MLWTTVFIKKIRNQKGHNKLTEKFRGPYRVISQKSPTVFRLRDLNDGKEKEVHTELIKIVKQRDIFLEDAPSADCLFPEGDKEVMTNNSQQTVTPQDTSTSDLPGQNITDPELSEEVNIPESQQAVEVEIHHPYRLRKRQNVNK